MENLMRWVLRHPLSVLLLVLIASLLAVWQLPKLQVHISPQGLAIADSPTQQLHQQTIETFGSDSIAILYVRDETLFTPAHLDLLRETVKRITQLPCVSHTQSLFSVPHLREENEFVYADPFLLNTPTTAAQAETIRQAALASPFVKNNLLSQDGKALAINIFLRPETKDLRFDARVNRELESAIAPLKATFDEVFHVGAPQVRDSISAQIWDDIRIIGPLAAGLLFVTMLLVLRRTSGVLIPLLTASVSVCWTLGLMAAFGQPINVMTAIVPILLVVIGSTEDIHLITEYYGGIARGRRRRRAVQQMIRRMGLTISLTFLTSFLGFLAIGFNPIQLVREFVVVAAAGLAISFFVTVLIVPLFLQYLGEKSVGIAKEESTRQTLGRIAFISRVLNHRRWVLSLTFVVVATATWFASSIQVNNSIMDYVQQGSVIHAQVETLHEEFSGLETFAIVLDGHVEGTFQRIRYLEEIESLQTYLRDNPAFDFNLSIADYVAVVNSVMDEDRQIILPEEDDVVESLLLFLRSDQIAPYINEDFSKARIVVRHNISASAQLNDELESLRHFIRTQMDPALDVEITGHAILSNEASDYLASSQALSLIFMLLMIFSVIAVLFVNLRAGLLAVVPNIFLVACLFGAMGYFGIPLDTGTTMIAAIALGVSVDHTMHFLVRYYKLTRQRVEPMRAVQQAAATEYRPIMAATLSLTAGFLALGLSGFTPVVYFGVLSAFVMLLAFYANFLLTPALLSYVRLTTLWDVLSVPMKRSLKTHCSLFQDMNELQIRHVLSLGEIRDYSSGANIFAEGAKSRELYVLLSGEVEVCHDGGEALRRVSDRNKIERIFGTTSLAQGRGHPCSATVIRDAKVLALDWERLAQIQKFRPRTGSLLFRNLSVIMARIAMKLDQQVEQDYQSKSSGTV